MGTSKNVPPVGAAGRESVASPPMGTGGLESAALQSPFRASIFRMAGTDFPAAGSPVRPLQRAGAPVPSFQSGGGLALVLVVALGLVWANLRVAPPKPEQRLAGYTTSLKGRKKAQIRNATLAARALNGRVIGAGKVFSYNAVVSASDENSDSGYVAAPVSVQGTMVPALGGGVCQTSTTLYNAALLAGLTVLERHTHTIAPHYVPPGRDAAVAWPGIDLRLKNPYPFAVRLQAQVVGERLRVEVYGARGLSQAIGLESHVLSVQEPGQQRVPGRRRGSAGSPGLRIATYRTVGRLRERLSDDTYATLDAVIPD